MPDTAGQLPSKTALRSHIDKLATNLVVGAAATNFEQELKELSRRAGQDGFLETSSLACQLVESLRSVRPESGVDTEHVLRQGLMLLQDVLSTDPGKVLQREDSTPAKPESQNGLAQDPELLCDFIMESREHLSSIEGLMLELEQNPGATDAIHSVFRGFHTIKGLAGFLEFAAIQRVSHEVETLLDLARNGKISIHTGVVDVVLESADYLKQSIDAVESEAAGIASKPVPDNRDLLVRIREAAQPVAPPPVKADEEPPREQRTNAKSNKAAEFSVRVETQKLDSLMDMVGEMVIAQSLVRHNPSLTAMQNPRLMADLAQLARITTEVQRTTMGMRMIPIGQLFQRTARMVRDLARKTGKKVELETSGEETEV